MIWYFFPENWHKLRSLPRSRNALVVSSHPQTIRKPERLCLPSPGDISTSALHGNSQGLLTQISSLPTRHSLASTRRTGVISQHDCLLLNPCSPEAKINTQSCWLSFCGTKCFTTLQLLPSLIFFILGGNREFSLYHHSNLSIPLTKFLLKK